MKTACHVLWSVLLFSFLTSLPRAGAQPNPGTRARYFVLTAKDRTPPPFVAVDLLYGPQEGGGGERGVWWQLEARAEADEKSVPLFVVRALTRADPLAAERSLLSFARYQLKITGTGEVYEYRDVQSGLALLPSWSEFASHFVPRAASSSLEQRGVPETCLYLGHVLTLFHVGQNQAWEPWPELKRLDLDRELLVGTSRNFKDREGRRLPQKPERQNYDYVPFTESDYRIMMDAGVNLFTVQPSQEIWVRGEPVFYVRSAGGDPPLRYPADLYRANYCGQVMFIDEPSIIMVGDTNIHRTLRYFSDAAALIAARTRETYTSADHYGAYSLEATLEKRGVNLGAMRLMQPDYPSWETLYETAFYQFAGGARGIVHEGRYQLEPFDQAVAKWTGTNRHHSAEEMLRYHYAFLRGAARSFGGFWGTSIYGQADSALTPRAVTLAYDLGARYLWFWTSDHDHHLPWPEQLALARTIKEHARTHPRRSLFQPPPDRDTALVIPNGYFLSLDNLWWVRVLDPDGKNEASQKYRRLMRRAFAAVYDCFARGEDFDITVDDGRPISGYRRVVRIDDRPEPALP